LHFTFLILPFPRLSLTLVCIVSTSNESAPLVESTAGSHLTAGQEHAVSPTPIAEINPNNPPWGLLAAFLIWLASVLLLFGMAFVFLVPYAALKSPGMDRQALAEFLATDKTALLLTVLSAIPAHLLTLGIIWAVVTHFGKRPFWRALGWSRGKGFGIWMSAGLAALLYVIAISMIYAFGLEETDTALARIVSSSRAAAIAIAFMAVVTAPLVEELVYRGVLYSALQKTAGRTWAIAGVLMLFTLIHVPQYWPNYGAIAAVGLLSVSLTLVRAYTGRLLPCFIMHLVFNGIQSALILFEPYLRQLYTKSEQNTAFIQSLPEAIRNLF
jgi:membrane protease YdiL (CAAX protease family)